MSDPSPHSPAPAYPPSGSREPDWTAGQGIGFLVALPDWIIVGLAALVGVIGLAAAPLARGRSVRRSCSSSSAWRCSAQSPPSPAPSSSTSASVASGLHNAPRRMRRTTHCGNGEARSSRTGGQSWCSTATLASTGSAAR